MFRWLGYTVFLVGRTTGVHVWDRRTAELLRGSVVTLVTVGASFCSPREKSVSVHQGFLQALVRLDAAWFTFGLGLGVSLERGFKKALRDQTLRGLSEMGVPDRMIEGIKNLLPWTYHTVRAPNGAVECVHYQPGEKQKRREVVGR
jgi:hypothetical protein